MHIYSINSINFTANPYKKIEINREALNKIKNNTKNPVKKVFYNNIDMYLDKKFSKKQFLDSINQIAYRIDNKVKLNDAEKQYIDDMITTMDLTAKSDSISDSYIKKNIKDLLIIFVEYLLILFTKYAIYFY